MKYAKTPSRHAQKPVSCHPSPTPRGWRNFGDFGCGACMTCWKMCHAIFVCTRHPARFLWGPQTPAFASAYLASPHKRRRAVARWLAFGSHWSVPTVLLRSTARSAARATARPQRRRCEDIARRIACAKQNLPPKLHSPLAFSRKNAMCAAPHHIDLESAREACHLVSRWTA